MIVSPKKAAELEQTLKARAGASELRKYVPEQLAFWPESQRAIANELARSALFQCSDNRKPRAYIDNVELYMLGEGQLTYKGEELRSKDEDIFISLAHRAREKEQGKLIVEITSSDLCKMNGWRQSQKYYDEIFLSIQRMKGGVINVISKRLARALKCERALAAGVSPVELARLYDELREYDELQAAPIQVPSSKNEEKGGMLMSLISGDPTYTGFTEVKNNIPQGNLTYEITLDKKMVSLFAKPYLTLMDSEARQALTPSGKRLQAFYMSHRNPYAVKLRSLEKMLGLNFSTLAALKFYMNQQFKELKAHNVIYDYEFKRSSDKQDWLVEVQREKPEEPEKKKKAGAAGARK